MATKSAETEGMDPADAERAKTPCGVVTRFTDTETGECDLPWGHRPGWKHHDPEHGEWDDRFHRRDESDIPRLKTWAQEADGGTGIPANS